MKKEIIKAIASGNLEFIKEHIDASQLNEKDAFGLTYLHHAINRSQTDIANYLILRGADVHTLDEYGNTTFMLALSKGDFTLAEQLYKLGVNTNARNTAGVCAF